jgi:hypothetical protein
MPTPIDPKRLPALRAALETFVADERLPHQRLAELYGVTPARLTTLIHNRFEGFPPAERQGDKTNWFPARPAVESMIAYLTNSGKKKHEAAARAATVMGTANGAAAAAEAEDDDIPPLGPVELDRMASAATRIWRLAVEQKRYVPVAEVRQTVRGMFDIVKREVQSIEHAIDPNGELPPLHRARLAAHCRELLVKAHEKLERFLGDDDAE